MSIFILLRIILRLDWIENVDEGCIEDYELAACTDGSKKRENEDDADENTKKIKS